jgi:hypothetical protein
VTSTIRIGGQPRGGDKRARERVAPHAAFLRTVSKKPSVLPLETSRNRSDTEHIHATFSFKNPYLTDSSFSGKALSSTPKQDHRPETPLTSAATSAYEALLIRDNKHKH